jgi:hypothetical protein
MNRDQRTAPWGAFRRAPVRLTGARDFGGSTNPVGRQSYGAWQPALQDETTMTGTSETPEDAGPIGIRSGRPAAEAA